MINVLKKYLPSICILMLFWLLFSLQFSLLNLVSGILFSFVSLWITNHFLLPGSYDELIRLDLIKLVKYFVYLFFNIFISGIKLIPIILKGESQIKIISYTTILKDPLEQALFANGITTTPGTVTIAQEQNELIILCFKNDNSFEKGKNNPLEIKLRGVRK